MNKSMALGTMIGAAVVTAGGAAAGYHAYRTAHSAAVVSVTETYKTIRTPRQECHDEQVTRTKPSQDPNRLVGTGIGAVVGGLLGNQIGGGSGRALATIAGAAGGGYAGNQIENKVQQGNTYTTTEQRCSTVYDTGKVPSGYDVVYRLNGEQRHVHMDHDPGRSLPIKDGHIVIESADQRAGSAPTTTQS